MKRLLLPSFVILLCACDSQKVLNTVGQIGQTMSGSDAPLTNNEVNAGLREALNVAAQRSVSIASAIDGFDKNERIRIPFPPEAITVRNTLLDLGLKKPVDDFELALNRAAEEAAKEAVPVFVDAIADMSIADGFAILNGNEDAATEYLRNKTSTALLAKFKPVVERATRKVALANQWTVVAKAYNTSTLITGAKPVEPDLNAYVTRKATDGLFVLLADEEKKIRQDPVARTTDLLRRVFGAH